MRSQSNARSMGTANKAARMSQDQTSKGRAYRRVSSGLSRCLRLGDACAERGDVAGAAEYVVGALRDLGPELATLTAAKPKRPAPPCRACSDPACLGCEGLERRHHAADRCSVCGKAPGLVRGRLAMHGPDPDGGPACAGSRYSVAEAAGVAARRQQGRR
jgi:hypothetical protein